MEHSGYYRYSSFIRIRLARRSVQRHHEDNKGDKNTKDKNGGPEEGVPENSLNVVFAGQTFSTVKRRNVQWSGKHDGAIESDSSETICPKRFQVSR
ncbi:MAG: hypothetical protein R3C08_07725, partial [Hyphomonas sp.]